ncbi:type IV pilus biogenesis/stability protein PilW [Acidihalobacter ferrooxydans]|uniref:Type IV pilus biogenesis/stability protein PilW n=1 Tax=Acidihalobacter ferrooxydans TaxID=1765967 RepID=A0A1P8UGU6_9GAMM|nr:type IV pilus biogenesis/stability protein PilW [Acidihalobacter ferrooxydans]APZ43066.1 type IV pilus biogenesis/stability protein PilW [Acidihalobacter ferrooxydans]
MWRSVSFLLFVSVVLISGCASQPTRVNEKRLHDAALINTQLGVDYMNSGNKQRAYDKLKLALSQDPNSSTVRYAYALLMQRLGENRKAQENFQKAIELNPKDSDARNNFGAFLCSQKRYQQAQRQFRAALGNPLYSTPQYAYANSGLCYLQEGDNSKATKAFKQALNVDPTFAPALYQLAKLAVGKGDWQKANGYLNQIKGTNRYTPSNLALCIRVKRNLGDTNGAANCARDLYRLFPNSQAAKSLLNGGT